MATAPPGFTGHQLREITGETSFMQSITAMPTHQQWSFEELRMLYYKPDNAAAGAPFASTSAFGVANNGVVPITLPAAQVWSAPRIVPSSNTAPLLEFSAEIVYFDVGEPGKSKRFSIHESIVSHASDFVRLALSHDWKEARERIIPLPEDEPDVFRVYQNWVYTRRIAPDFVATPTNRTSIYHRLVKCFILGEKMMDNLDAVMDSTIDHLRTSATFDVNLSNLVYDSTPEGSPLRRLLCEVYVWCATASWLNASVVTEEVNPGLLADIAKMHIGFWQGQRPPEMPFLGDRCGYHSHLQNICYRPTA